MGGLITTENLGAGKKRAQRTLDNNVAVLAESRALHGEGEGGTCAGLIIRGRQIFRDLAGRMLKNGTYVLDHLVVLLIVRHD